MDKTTVPAFTFPAAVSCPATTTRTYVITGPAAVKAGCQVAAVATARELPVSCSLLIDDALISRCACLFLHLATINLQ